MKQDGKLPEDERNSASVPGLEENNAEEGHPSLIGADNDNIKTVPAGEQNHSTGDETDIYPDQATAEPVSDSNNGDSAENEDADAEKIIGEEVPEETGGSKKRKRKPYKTVGLIIIFASIAAVLIFIISALIDFYAIGKSNTDLEVTIQKDTNFSQVAGILKADGVINNEIAFRIYVKLKNASGLQYGIFTLNSDMTYDEIISALQHPAAGQNTVEVTIPEGKTLQQIDELLYENGVCGQGELIAALKAADFSPSFSFVSQIPDNEGRYYKYEGYLFPDTYELYTGSTAATAAQKMLKNFDDRFTSDMYARASELGMSIDQVLTLASIIQAESGDVRQMAMVSSVFHNRLSNGVAALGGAKYLQSDATIFYVIRNILSATGQSSVGFSTGIDSSYNTYKHEGLPPGPICNPGVDAINAALYPAQSNYYYFVTDSSGNYYYATTYADHLANVRRAGSSSSMKGTDVSR